MFPKEAQQFMFFFFKVKLAISFFSSYAAPFTKNIMYRPEILNSSLMDVPPGTLGYSCLRDSIAKERFGLCSGSIVQTGLPQ